MQWYVSQNGKTSGPFSEERIEMLVNWDKVSSDAYLCDDKWSCWVSITRSHFAPMLAARRAELAGEVVDLADAPRAPSLHPPAGSSMHRLAFVLLIMLAAVAFALAFFLAPDSVPGPIGFVVVQDVLCLLASASPAPALS